MSGYLTKPRHSTWVCGIYKEACHIRIPCGDCRRKLSGIYEWQAFTSDAFHLPRHYRPRYDYMMPPGGVHVEAH